jgi:hypothetical protein
MTQRAARREKLASKGRKDKQERITKAEVRAMIRSNNNLVLERKVTYTRQSGGVDFNAAGTVFDLTAALTRGDAAVDQFQGNIIYPKSLVMRCGWNTSQTFSQLRLMVFQWEDASVPTGSGVFALLGFNLAPFSPLLWTNEPKIHVLCDEITTLFPVAGSSAATNFVLSVDKMKPIFFASGSTLMQKNGLYAIAVSDDGVPLYPQLDFISELRFTDA